VSTIKVSSRYTGTEAGEQFLVIMNHTVHIILILVYCLAQEVAMYYNEFITIATSQ